LGLLQGWLDIGAIGHFIAVVLHLGLTFNLGLLFVNLYFYIFNQQRFRADTATIPALQQALPVVGNFLTHSFSGL
jgi:nicotinamide riboside transporter PnuC